jgi:hypothetical protein
METIYLVGQISPKYEQTYLWRRNVRKHYKDVPEIDIIDPCANPFNQRVLQENAYAVSRERRVGGIDVLPPKDYTYCKRSSIAMVNMNQHDPNKPLLGSFYELAWYYTMPEKVVIAFSNDLYDYLCQHPFVRQTVHVWCNNEFEACEIVDTYFKTVEDI